MNLEPFITSHKPTYEDFEGGADSVRRCLSTNYASINVFPQ
jgi:hypothetical protein